MERRESNERKNTLIKAILIAILLLLAFLSSVIYIYAYPKTTVTLYDDRSTNYSIIKQYKIKKYSPIGNLSAIEKAGHTFLYWSYTDGSVLDPDREVETDTVELYANYQRNEYTVTFHVQIYNDDAQQEGYTSNQPGYRTQTALFGSSLNLPYGTVDGTEGGALLPELTDRIGYHFVGWTTQVDEEDVISANDVYLPGAEFIIPAGNTDLYAYWAKNEYSVITHTGNSYQGVDKVTGNGTPIRDEFGDFVIRNDREESELKMKYLDNLAGITSVTNPTLTLELDGEDYAEYKFVGWYLDEALTISAENTNYTLVVKVEGGFEVPYLAYMDSEEKVYYISPVLNGEGEYEFHLYSKWERKSYQLLFNNNHAGSNGKVAPITVYKYDTHYGKHYVDEFSREVENIGYFSTLNLSDSVNITTNDFLNSNKGYKFIGWSTTPQVTDENNVQYYRWYQDPVSYDLNGNIIYSAPKYIDSTYRHEVSEDVTLYALWSRIRNVIFYEKNGNNIRNGKDFTVTGIAGEWFPLLSSAQINEWGWAVNDYTEFAGWNIGKNSTSNPILEKIDGNPNPNYYFTFTTTSSTTTIMCAYWKAKSYTIIYHHNDGTDNKTIVNGTGGISVTHPTNISRVNYIFDGWSKTQYPDNTLNKEIIATSTFKPTGANTVIEYYASWTQKFTVEYDYGVTEGSEEVTGNLPASHVYTKKNGNMILNAKIGSGSTLKRTGYNFKGWVLLGDEGYNTNNVFKTGVTLTFNFVPNADDGNLYCYLSNQITNQIKFRMDQTEPHKVKLYALWEAKTYTISIHDTVSKVTKDCEAKYGVDFNFYDHIDAPAEGYILRGLSTSANGELAYSPDTTMIIPGTSIVGNLSFYVLYEIKNISIVYMIKAEDNNSGSDTIFEPSLGYSGFGGEKIKYNSILTLPTPTIANPNKIFSYWYYTAEDDSEIIVQTGDRLSYTGDVLTLYAKFEELMYKMTFTFTNKVDGTSVNIDTMPSDEGEVKITVKKGDVISAEIYDYIMEQLELFIAENNIVQYTFDGIYNGYLGKTYKFVSGQTISAVTFPVIDVSDTIHFETVWEANAIEIVYYSSGEEGAQSKKGLHGGIYFDHNSQITLEDPSKMNFTYTNGEEVKRWFLRNSQGELVYLELSSILVSSYGNGYFSSLSEMTDYIVWAKDQGTGKYVGTISIYAETQQVFTLEFYRFFNGRLEKLQTLTHIYAITSNQATLLPGSNALLDYGTNMSFNGWVVYSNKGRVTSLGDNGLVTSASISIDPETFSDFTIRCYADLTFTINYYYLIETDGVFSKVSLDTETHTLISDRNADYSVSGNYVTEYSINSYKTGFDVVDGYEYYGYRINNIVYPLNEISENGVKVVVNGNPIEILAFLTKVITLTYTISGDEVFSSPTYADSKTMTFKYVLGYDNSIIAERTLTEDVAISSITIPNVSVLKEGYIFSGWQIRKNGSVVVYTYEIGDILNVTEDTDFVPVFTTPEAGSLTAIVVYKDNNGKTLKTYEVKNGASHTIISGTASGYVHADYAIMAWTYTDEEGQIHNYNEGDSFIIPLLIENGQQYVLEAVLKEKFTIKFETYSSVTLPEIITFDEVENVLTDKPTLDNGYEFKYWELKFGGDTPAQINYNDIVVISTKATQYSKVNTVNGNVKHTIPVVDNFPRTYILYAVSKTEISVKLYATGVNALGQTVTVEDTLLVPFGSSFTARELVNDEMKTLETNGRKILAWTNLANADRTDAGDYSSAELTALENNIQKIIRDTELFAVWQSTYTLNFATADSTFGYKSSAPSTEYYFEGESVTISADVIKSIYYKGTNTVYFVDGKVVVYNLEGNDYYYIAGVILNYGGQDYELYLTDSCDATFVMPGANVTVTPMERTQSYKVEFYRNADQSDELITTVYTKDLSDINLSEYESIRVGYEFAGWHTDPLSETALDNLDNITDYNVKLYAVWSSNYAVSFHLDGNLVFNIKLNRSSKIPYETLNDYMTQANGSDANGWLKNVKDTINGNARAYNYNNINYYFRYFTYKNTTYNTIEELCNITISDNYTVYMVVENIYTIDYLAGTDKDDESPDSLETYDYVIESGRLTAITESNTEGVEEFTTKSSSGVENGFYKGSSWKDSYSNTYDFNKTLTSDQLNQLISTANSDKIITLTLVWLERDIEFVLNFTETPYTLYSGVSSQADLEDYAGWENIASTYLKDETGNDTSGFAKYLSTVMISLDLPEEDYEGYVLIGWSLTPYKLGYLGDDETPEDMILSYNGERYTDYFTVSETIINDDFKVVLYPVFSSTVAHSIAVDSINGGYSYNLTYDTNILKGYIHDETGATDNSNTFTTVEYGINKVFSLAKYSILTIKADKPETFYTFDYMTTTIGSISGNTLTINGTDTSINGTCDSCEELVSINYSIQRISINLSLDYSVDLAGDTSTITLTTADQSTVTLSATSNTATLSVPAIESIVVDLNNISQYFDLSSIIAGTTVLSIVNEELRVIDMISSGSSEVDVVFTLTPKTYTVTIVSVGGTIASDIGYNSSVFGVGTITLEEGQSSFEVYQNAKITIPDPVRPRYAFSYWSNNLNSTTNTSLATTGIDITSDITFTANYSSTVKSMYYQLIDGTFVEFDFNKGDTLYIGRDKSGNLISDRTPLGYTHLYWTIINDNSGTEYYDDDELDTEFRDYRFIQKVKGANVTVNFLYETDSVNTVVVYSMTVENGSKFTLPESDANFENLPSNMSKALFGYSVSPKSVTARNQYEKGTITDLEKLGYNVNTNGYTFTLYTCYYPVFTFTFDYDSEDIADQTIQVVASNDDGDVDSSKLVYTISAKIPSVDSYSLFAGYTVTIEIDGTTYYTYLVNNQVEYTTTADINKAPWTVTASDSINLVRPTNYDLASNYVYKFTTKTEPIAGSTEFKLYITDPRDATGNTILPITHQGTTQDYFPINLFTNNNIYVSSFPYYDYEKLSTNATWEFTSNPTEFTTENANLIAYKLLGYKLTFYIDTIQKTENILFDDPSKVYALGGGTDYSLVPIWQDRYSVAYYDESGSLIESDYYDLNTVITIEKVSEFAKDEHAFVGYTFIKFNYAQGEEVTSLDEFIKLGTELEISQNYTFYPAYTRIYNVNFSTSSVTLENAGGDDSSITVDKNESLSVYLGQDPVNLEDYFIVGYFGSGYKVAGYTTVPNKVANDLDASQVYTNYVFDYSHLNAGIVNIYIAWECEVYDITFVMNAKWKDGSIVDSSTYEITYRHGQTIKFEDQDQTLNSYISALPRNFYLIGYSLNADGTNMLSGDVVATSNTIIYVIFGYKFTLVYNMEGASLVDGASGPQVKTYKSGEKAEAFDTNNIIYDGLSDLRWTANGENFFVFADDKYTHTFSSDDLKYADNNYIITLNLAGSVSQYTVNLHVIKNLANYKAGKYSDPYTLTLDFGTELFNDDYEVDGDGHLTKVPSSPFDTLIANDSSLNVNTLYDLFNYFDEQGFTVNYEKVKVNGNEDIYMWDTFSSSVDSALCYRVGTYANADGKNRGRLVNDVYLVYEATDLNLEVYTVISKSDSVTDNQSLDYSFTNKIDNLFYVDNNPQGGYSNLPTDEDKQYYYLTIENEVDFTPMQNNIAYTNLGFFSAVYNADGSVKYFTALNGDEWEKTTSEYDYDGDGVNDIVYKIKKSCKVYVIYLEKPVDVIITYECAGSDDYSSLIANISLTDNKGQEYTNLVKTESTNENGQKVVTIKALYGDIITITDGCQEPFGIEGFGLYGIVMNGKSITRELTNVSADLDYIAISIIFHMDTSSIYVRTYYDNYEGTLNSISYTDYSGETKTINITNPSDYYAGEVYNNKIYNYLVKVPYGSTLTAISVSLNNYNVTGYYLNTATTDVVSFPHELTSSITYFTPRYEAISMRVEFYTTQLAEPTLLEQFTITGKKYGETITLPTAVIEEELYVSKGWILNNVEYDWGQVYTLVTSGNTAMPLIDGVGVVKFYANSVGKYYLTFAGQTYDGITAEELGIELPENFANYTTKNSLIVTTESVNVSYLSGLSHYYLVDANNLNNIPTSSKVTITENTTVFSQTINIPTELLLAETQLKFGGWGVYGIDVITIEHDLFNFSSNCVTNDNTDHIITAYLVDNGKVVLRFYITNPTAPSDETKDIKISSNTNEEFNKKYISVVYDLSSKDVEFIVPVEETETHIQWGNGENFTVNNFENYEFHGWSPERLSSTISPSADYPNILNSTALRYTISTTTGGVERSSVESSSELTARLNALILNSAGTEVVNRNFYAIWEEKKHIKFDASGYKDASTGIDAGVLHDGYHAEGEVLTIYNSVEDKTNYINLVNENKKWIGWIDEDTNPQVTIEFNSTNNSKYTFTVQNQDQNFKTVWVDGVHVQFNVNFDSWRTYFADAFSPSTGKSTSEILTTIGYPNLDEDTMDTNITSAITTTIGDTDYTKVYKYGDLFQVGDKIEVYKLNALSQQDIYGSYGAEGISYFDFKGWFIDSNGNGTLDSDSEELISEVDEYGRIVLTITADMMTSGTVVLMAHWEPITFEVKFYYSQSDAVNNTSSRYQYANENAYLNVTSAYVTFGKKFTTFDDTKYTNNGIEYLYEGANAQCFEDISFIKNYVVESKLRVFYRFSYWSNYDAVDNENVLCNDPSVDFDENTISNPVIGEMRLYPNFINQYQVLFYYKETKGSTLITDFNGNNIVTTVIDGESIPVKSLLEKYVDINIINTGYYLDKSESQVSVLTNGGQFKDSVVFDESNFTIDDSKYIRIYFTVNVGIAFYAPDYSGETPITTNVTTYSAVLGKSKSINIPNNSNLVSITGATFDGWFLGKFNDSTYYSDPNSNAYKVNGSKIFTSADSNKAKRMSIVSKSDESGFKYYLQIGTNEYEIKASEDASKKGIYASFYAHFVVQTTIKVDDWQTTIRLHIWLTTTLLLKKVILEWQILKNHQSTNIRIR